MEHGMCSEVPVVGDVLPRNGPAWMRRCSWTQGNSWRSLGRPPFRFQGICMQSHIVPTEVIMSQGQATFLQQMQEATANVIDATGERARHHRKAA